MTNSGLARDTLLLMARARSHFGAAGLPNHLLTIEGAGHTPILQLLASSSKMEELMRCMGVATRTSSGWVDDGERRRGADDQGVLSEILIGR